MKWFKKKEIIFPEDIEEIIKEAGLGPAYFYAGSLIEEDQDKRIFIPANE